MELLLQTLWPKKNQSLTAKFTARPSELEEGCPPSPTFSGSHPSRSDLSANLSFHLDQIMLRREDGPMRLLLAPLGGAIEGISRKINPSAGKYEGTNVKSFDDIGSLYYYAVYG